MADSTISNLPLGTPGSSDFVPVAKLVSPGVYTTIKTTVSQLADGLVPVLDDLYVNVDGDTMTGTLSFVDPAVDVPWHMRTNASTFEIFADTFDQIMVLNPGTASLGNIGQTITGRFRYAMPIIDVNVSGSVVVESGSEGVTTGLVVNSSGSTITIRNNTSSLIDFDEGNFFSVMQEGVTPVTIEGETANVILRVPTGFMPTTRNQYSVISATLYKIDSPDQYWVISGDLAEAP